MPVHQAYLQPSQLDMQGERSRAYEWDDPAISAAAARELAGEAFLTALLNGSLPAPPVARTLDFAPVTVQPGNVVFEFTPAEFHYNPIGTVHGGVLSTLCDSACGCAVQSMLPAGTYYTSLDLSVKFLRPVSFGTGLLTLAAGRRWRRHGLPTRPESCTRMPPAAA
jgi:uncharacterized protein (TIGR00369 family)